MKIVGSQNTYGLDLAIIRHGRTELNEKRCYTGEVDEDLSETGRAEVTEAKGHAPFPGIQRVYVSNKKRAMQTASILYPGAEQICVPELRELSFGEYEGQDYEHLKERADYCAWLDGGGIGAPPGGESRAVFLERVKKGFLHVLWAEKDSREAVIAAHGGTLMAIESMYTDKEFYDCMVEPGGSLVVHVEFIAEDDSDVRVSHFRLYDRCGAGSADR